MSISPERLAEIRRLAGGEWGVLHEREQLDLVAAFPAIGALHREVMVLVGIDQRAHEAAAGRVGYLGAPESEVTRRVRSMRDQMIAHALTDDATPYQASEPVGLKEIAERAEVNPQTAKNWKQRGVLPNPRWTVGGDDAWCWIQDIAPWLRATGRLDQM